MRRSRLILSLVLAVAAAPRVAAAVKVADLTDLSGARTNVLSGYGLVVGLKGTGDGGTFLPAIRPLAKLLSQLGNRAGVADLSNASNVAVVLVTATVSKDGGSNGEHLDVRVLSTGAATSLQNGQLYMAALLGPDGQPYTPHDALGNALPEIPYALANGPLDLEDPRTPTAAIVKGGATLEVNMPTQVVDPNGRFTLVMKEPAASWTTASTIAKLINESNDAGDAIVLFVDSKHVVVQIPVAERAQPAAFISEVLRLPVPLLPTEARVVINDKTGTMVVTGDVEISPTVISHSGLTISTVTPAPVGTAKAPLVNTRQSVPLDTTAAGGAKLADLAAALDQLKVPVNEQIKIVKELYDSGALHAKLTINGEEK